MPGLIRGMARTAAVVGTATAVSNGVSRRQASKWDKQAQEQQAQQLLAAAPSVTAAASNLIKLQGNSGVPVL